MIRQIRANTPLESTGLDLGNGRELQVPGRHGMEEMRAMAERMKR